LGRPFFQAGSSAKNDGESCFFIDKAWPNCKNGPSPMITLTIKAVPVLKPVHFYRHFRVFFQFMPRGTFRDSFFS